MYGPATTQYSNKKVTFPTTVPTMEELTMEMKGAQYFTKLDASSGFWQIPLDESSSKLWTFATPFGRFRFCRLPFGIKSAPEVFQKKYTETLW